MFYSSEYKLGLNQKMKILILSVENVHRVQRRNVFAIFLVCDEPRWKSFRVTETIHKSIYYRFVLHTRIDKCIPQLFCGKLG